MELLESQKSSSTKSIRNSKSLQPTSSRAKGSKTADTQMPREKGCIICNQIKRRRDTRKLYICGTFCNQVFRVQLTSCLVNFFGFS